MIQETHITRYKERGFVLIMALVFLVLLTIIGVTALGTTSLEEKMAGNVKDKNLAFQAAEAAAVTAENWLNAQLSVQGLFPNTTSGLYKPDSTSASAIWESLNWTGGSGYIVYPNTPTQTVSGGLNKISTQPKFIIEYLTEVPDDSGSLTLSSSYRSKNKSILRITAQGTGGTDAAVSMVQTTYGRYY